MTRLSHVVADSNDPSRLARFWTEALGWRIVIDEHEVEIAGSDTPWRTFVAAHSVTSWIGPSEGWTTTHYGN